MHIGNVCPQRYRHSDLYAWPAFLNVYLCEFPLQSLKETIQINHRNIYYALRFLFNTNTFTVEKIKPRLKYCTQNSCDSCNKGIQALQKNSWRRKCVMEFKFSKWMYVEYHKKMLSEVPTQTTLIWLMFKYFHNLE